MSCPKTLIGLLLLAIVTLPVTPSSIVRSGKRPMFKRALHGSFLLVLSVFLMYTATAQQGPIHMGNFFFFSYGAVAKQQGPMHLGSAGTQTAFGNLISADLSQVSGAQTMWSVQNAGDNRSPLETPSGSISKLDLKAPG